MLESPQGLTYITQGAIQATDLVSFSLHSRLCAEDLPSLPFLGRVPVGDNFPVTLGADVLAVVALENPPAAKLCEREGFPLLCGISVGDELVVLLGTKELAMRTLQGSLVSTVLNGPGLPFARGIAISDDLARLLSAKILAMGRTKVHAFNPSCRVAAARAARRNHLPSFPLLGLRPVGYDAELLPAILSAEELAVSALQHPTTVLIQESEGFPFPGGVPVGNHFTIALSAEVLAVVTLQSYLIAVMLDMPSFPLLGFGTISNDLARLLRAKIATVV